MTISKNKIFKVAGLAFVAALALSGGAGVSAQTTLNMNLTINKTVRNVSLGQTSFFESVGAVPGDLVEFRIHIQNNGSYPAYNVVVTDTLPANFVLVSGSTVNNLGTLALGAGTTLTFTARVGEAAAFPFGQSTWTNSAVVTASNQGSSSVPALDTAQVVVTRNGDPNVSVNMAVRNISAGTGFAKLVSAKINDQLEFRIIVTNSNAVAANVRVIDNLPPDLRYMFNTLRIDGVGSQSGDLFNSHVLLGDLPSGSSRTITYNAAVNIYAQAGVVFTNTATAFMNNGSLRADGVQITVIPVSGSVAGASAELILSNRAFNQTQSQDATTVTAQINDLIIYTLTVVNRGSVAVAYTIEDDLSDVLKHSNLVDFNGGEFLLGAYKLRWPNVTIQPGSQVQKTFSVRVRANSETDRVMTNVFGNWVDVPVSTPSVKGAFIAPKTGPGGWLSLWLALVSTIGFYLYRFKRKLA